MARNFAIILGEADPPSALPNLFRPAFAGRIMNVAARRRAGSVSGTGAHH